ncbi:MAG: hypothetical protein TQ37_06965 [Candidatus Synechococcus spongiarum 15L]|uniref:Uncharacterized protein n=1 Tax=Candidatus Synechococcus spongiarum 15L TaxID=1608419 RepID=A0A0G8AUD5_9SYNE|nr:MAG: hypothetical protein TQ37_06965 [Candidatus Synechococcus spongiarum 15L]
MTIAHQHQGEHIHHVALECRKGGEGNALLRPGQLAADGHRCATGALCQQDSPGLLQLPDPLLGTRIVEGYHEISQGSGLEALPNGGPGGEFVTQADDAKIMHQRPTESGGCHLERGNARMHCKIGTLLFR